MYDAMGNAGPDAAFPDRGAGFSILPRDRTTRALVVAALALFLAGYAVKKIAPRERVENSDFTLYAPAGRAILDGEPVYGTNERGRHYHFGECQRPLYPPPPMALVMLPFSLLPIQAGALLWFALKLVMLYAMLRMSLRLAGCRREPWVPWAALAVLVLMARILGQEFDNGQINLFMCFLALLGVYWTEYGARSLAGGAALAAAAVVKQTPALLAMPFFTGLRRREMLGFLGGLVLWLVVVPSIVLGPGQNLHYIQDWFGRIIWNDGGSSLLANTNGSRVDGESLRAVCYLYLSPLNAASGRDGFVHRINLLDLTPGAAQRCYLAAVAVSGLALLALAWKLRRKPGARAVLYGVLFAAMPALSPYSLTAHFVALLYPYALAVAALFRLPRGTIHWRVLAGGTAASFLLNSVVAKIGNLDHYRPMFWGSAALALGLVVLALGDTSSLVSDAERSQVREPESATDGAPIPDPRQAAIRS